MRSGDLIKMSRTLAAKKAVDVARAVGMTPQYLCDIERGGRFLPTSRVSAFAHELAIPVDDLMLAAILDHLDSEAATWLVRRLRGGSQ